MSCNCKETRKVKSCPTVSVEETILTELRNLYDFLVAKFLALFTTVGTPMQAKNVTARYQTFDVAAETASPGSITIPARCVCLSFQPIGGDVENTAIFTGPSGQTLDMAAGPVGERPTVTFPLPAGVYHEAGEWLATMHVLYPPGTIANWRIIATYEEP